MYRLFHAGRGMIAGAVLAVMAGAAPVASAPPQAAPPVLPAPPVLEAARVIAVYPHDTRAFTQGLFFSDGRLFESTGQHGQSVVREVDLVTGRVQRQVGLPVRYFGEGATAWKNTIVSLTWTHGRGFRWNRDTLRKLGEFSYPGEGWGLTQDGRHLIMSDGTAALRFLDPETFAETHRVEVTWQGRPVRQLNELEYVRGEVLANIWHSDVIARIDPASGVVKGFLDLSAIIAQSGARGSESVLNGIAYDEKTGKLYVTGKRWPKLFEIALPGTP